MSALLNNNENQVQATAIAERILVMGPASRGIAGALLRMESRAEIVGVETVREAIELLREGNYDHVLVDNREDGAMSLTIPTLARLENVANITVLAGPNSAETISAIPGIANVIVHPYNPIEIAGSLGIEIKDSRKQNSEGENKGRREADRADEEVVAETTSRPENPEVEEKVEDEDDRSILIRAVIAAANFIPGFTPLLSVIYKNLALTILASLFVAFVGYGIMIAFFLTSNDWSNPLQLQRGHELVMKAERERGELQVKRNLIKQQISDAQNKAERGRQSLERADTLARIAEVTINQEMQNREARLKLLTNEIETLKNLIAAYGPSDERKVQRQALINDYNRRVVTRHVYQQSLLNMAEIEKTLVSLREQVSRKETEATLNRQATSYLSQLLSQLQHGGENLLITAGNAEFVPIANQIIEVNQIRSNGKADISEYETSSRVLGNSEKVLTGSIKELEKTPMIAALEKPVNVLFVPYDNLSGYEENQRLFTCAIAVFWCSEVGTVGKPINGEIITTHPFFGKPIRGQFVQANLTEKSAAQKEIIHVGRPPFFF